MSVSRWQRSGASILTMAGLALSGAVAGAQGFTPGGPSGVSGPGGIGRPVGSPALAQGRQGGVVPGGPTFGLSPGQTVQVAAYCTDLFSAPPNQTTTFTGGDQAQVAVAGHGTLTLASAMQSGLVAIRGRSNSYDPIRRDRNLALDLYLVNTSDTPMQVAFTPGTQITPKGQGAQALPAGSERLFALAGQKRLAYTNTMQFAVWASRGSTAEDVEQTQMLRVPADERTRVQNLLDGSGIAQTFDRDRGAYAARYEAAVEKLGDGAQEVRGVTVLADGYRAQVEGARTDTEGVVRVKPLRSGGTFYYRAEFQERKDGRTDVKLFHLVTGRPLHANRGGFVL